MSKIENSVILITGADGGIGSALLMECVKRKAFKIYASGLSLAKLEPLVLMFPNIVVPVLLDVTDESSVKNAALNCNDINILINNAGVELKSEFIGENVAQKALFEMKVNYIGVLSMINEFLPVLKEKTSSSIINILSVGSVAIVKRLETYCASKAATHWVTQSIRDELKNDNIEIVGVYPGYVDTEMSSDITFEKITPSSLSETICNEFESGTSDIFPDKMSADVFTKRPIVISYLR